jgi:DNA-binding NarL/FixJ family response regulator
VLVSDRPVLLAGLAGLLEGQPGVEVVGEARNATEALKRTRELGAELVVACSPCDGSGAQLVRRLHGAQPHLKIVGFALQDDSEHADQMVRAGAVTCIAGSADRRAVVDGVRAAAGSPRSSHLAGNRRASSVPPSGPLSRRELEVLTMIAEGNTNKQVAERLGISVRTVETHRERVMRKLNAQGTAALTKWAISLGLVHPSG